MAEQDTLQIDITGIPLVTESASLFSPLAEDTAISPVTGESVSIVNPEPGKPEEQSSLLTKDLDSFINLEDIPEVTSPLTGQPIEEQQIESPYSIRDPRHPQHNKQQGAMELMYGVNATFKAAFPLLWAEVGIAGPIDAIQNKQPGMEILKSVPRNYRDYIVSIVQDLAQAGGKNIPKEELVRAKDFSDNWATYYKATTGKEAPLWYKASAGVVSLMGLSMASSAGREFVKSAGETVMKRGTEMVQGAKALPAYIAESKNALQATRKMIDGLKLGEKPLIDRLVKNGMRPYEAKQMVRGLLTEQLRPQVVSGGTVDNALMATFARQVQPIAAQVEQQVAKKGIAAMFELSEQIVKPVLSEVPAVSVVVKAAEAPVFAELLKAGIFKNFTLVTTTEGLAALEEAGIKASDFDVAVAPTEKEAESLAKTGERLTIDAEGNLVPVSQKEVGDNIVRDATGKAMELGTENGHLKDIRQEIAGGTPGERVPVDAGIWMSMGSTYPDYFRNKGYTKTFALNAIDKYLSGAKLGEKQQAFIDDMRQVALDKDKKTKEQEVEYIAQEKDKSPKYKKPTAASLITAQNRYAELLGVKKLVEPLERAKMKYDPERRSLTNDIKKVVTSLKKLKTITPEQMAVLLNTNKDAPIGMGEKEKAVFDYFRALTREILTRTNEVRSRTGREPIKDIGAYFRHIAGQAAKDVLNGKIPMPEKMKEWANKNIPKEIRNAMEIERKTTDEMLKVFSNDLETVMVSMVNIGLKEIHFDEALEIYEQELAGTQIDTKLMEKMSPEEKVAYRAMEELPAETKKWLDDYVKIVLLAEKQTTIDQRTNQWLADGPVADFFNTQLAKYGKHLSSTAFTDMLTTVSKLPLYGVIGGFRPKLLIRNKMQLIQNTALYGIWNTIKGTFPTSDYPVLEKIKSESDFLITYSGIETVHADLRGKMSKAMMASFQWTAVTNVSQAMNSAYHWTVEQIQNPKMKDLGWADPKRTGTEDDNFFYPSELTLIKKEMEYGAQTTEYQYLGMAMPEIFRYKALAPLTQLQSWWMNHWAVFLREAATRAIKGHVGYTVPVTYEGAGPDGEDIVVDVQPKISAQSRKNFWKYLILGGVVLNSLGYGKSYVLGTVPTAVPPTAQLVLSMIKYYTASDTPYGKSQKQEALNEIKRAAKTFIPGYLMYNDISKLLRHESRWQQYWFYGAKNKGTGTSGV